jgi:F-type H+-transporting ATPase subunit delta
LGQNSSNGTAKAAARYAAALYDLASEQAAIPETVEQMDAVGKLFAQDAALRRLAASPLADPAKVAPALDAALAAQNVTPLVRNFLRVAIANRRLPDLPALIAGFADYAAAKRGEIIAEVATAIPLTDLQRTQLRARLTESGYGSVRLNERTDASLLGGLVLKIGPKLYDTSLKSRLSRLSYSLKGAA